MKNKKLIKIFLFGFILLVFIILIILNVTATKETPLESTEIGVSTSLDINSELVQSLYNDLNMSLVSSNYNENDNYLYDDNYDFWYFTNPELSDDIKLYMTINDMYLNNLINISQDNNYEIDINLLNNYLNKYYGITDFTSFNYNIKKSTCGITDFIYGGDKVSITFQKCASKDTYGYAKVISAYKNSNQIFMDLQIYKVVNNKDVYNIQENELITELDINTNVSNLFNDKIDTYTFTFTLKNDNLYHLNEVKRK